MSREKKPHCLIGKVVRAVFLADDREAIKFELSDGQPAIVSMVNADCCSHTWIEDILGCDAILDSPVLEVGDLELPDALCGVTKTDNSEEEMQYYGFFVQTAKGRCTIAYRNSSNGYYGGSLVWPSDDYFYGGVFQQNVSKMQWQPVVEVTS